MTLPLKPDAIAAIYEYLRLLPPFSSLRKRLPHADEVEFWVIKDRSCYALWQWTGKRHRVSVSAASVGQTITLIDVVGHEMCHIAVWDSGKDTGGTESAHNAAFRKLAARFCKVHGIDLKAFY